MNFKNIRLVTSVIVLASLAACGGGGGGGATTAPAGAISQGTFIDSAVGGMAYTCGTTSGTTDSAGHFDYVAGSTCTFTVGGITIGSSAAASTITPVSLVPGASDETHPKVTNIGRFLQSLDSDGNTSNGIVIDSAVAANLAADSLDFSSAGFTSAAQTLVTKVIAARALLDSSTAQSHMRASILNQLAGNYNCTYSGTDQGTATVTLTGGSTINGTVSGSAHSTLFNQTYSVSGTYLSSGSSSFTAGGASSGATFTGNMSVGGAGTGSWQNTGAGGSWSCSKIL